MKNIIYLAVEEYWLLSIIVISVMFLIGGKIYDKGEKIKSGGLRGLAYILIVPGIISFWIIFGFWADKGMSYISDIDFSLPEISLFGESEKDKKIKKLEDRIKRLESNRGTANEIRELKKCVQDISMGLPCYPY